MHFVLFIKNFKIRDKPSSLVFREIISYKLKVNYLYQYFHDILNIFTIKMLKYFYSRCKISMKSSLIHVILSLK